MYKPELLAPAGNLEKLKIAIRYGADAVFVGGKKFSLRASAANFDINDIEEGVKFAQSYNAKVYVVVNIIFHNKDLDGLKEYLIDLERIGVVGIICADLIVIDYLKKYAPRLEIHISTQQSITNEAAVAFYENLQVDRVVLGREVSYEELKLIKANTKIELEYFVHGAMCVAYSGRCMMSNYYSNRDSNRGGCSQSCRWNYQLLQEQEDSVINLTNPNTPFTMSSKDLALIEDIPKLIDLEIASFKIEGRMKSIYYLATIVSTYRKLIDD
ncbi:MAG: peptidase U32 family protein, partial [Bacilli bacterium]